MNKRDKYTLSRAALSYKNTVAANRRFRSMNRMQQRVAVAKDVLKLLDTKRAVAKRGTYMGVTEATNDKISGNKVVFPPGMKLKRLVHVPSVQCEVCGIGAVFMAAVACRGVDGDHIALLEMYNNRDSFLSPLRGYMIEHLAPYFTAEELHAMEGFFEDYSHRYDMSDDDALRALMEAIINSKGVEVVPSTVDL